MGEARNVIYLDYGDVASLWNVIGSLIENEKLLEKETDEVVVIDGEISHAKTVLEWNGIKKTAIRPHEVTIGEKNNKTFLILHFDCLMGELLKMFEVTIDIIEHEDEFSTDLKENKGIIRLTK